MYCKDCSWRDKESYCQNEYLHQDEYDFHYLSEKEQSFCLVYQHYSGGYSKVSNYFGCIHFKGKDKDV